MYYCFLHRVAGFSVEMSPWRLFRHLDASWALPVGGFLGTSNQEGTHSIDFFLHISSILKMLLHEALESVAGLRGKSGIPS